MVGVSDDDLYGFIEKVGGGLVLGTNSGEIANPGIGYSASVTPDLVSLYTLTGKGSGATAKVTTNASGEVTEIDVLTRGEGYAIGDLLGITTAHVQKGLVQFLQSIILVLPVLCIWITCRVNTSQ